MPPMVVADQSGTRLSPCSPMTRVWTSLTWTWKYAAMSDLSRIESRCVPRPKTWLVFSFEYFRATLVMTSTGLVTTRIFVSGATWPIFSARGAMTRALPIARSRRSCPAVRGFLP